MLVYPSMVESSDLNLKTLWISHYVPGNKTDSSVTLKEFLLKIAVMQL